MISDEVFRHAARALADELATRVGAHDRAGTALTLGKIDALDDANGTCLFACGVWQALSISVRREIHDLAELTDSAVFLLAAPDDPDTPDRARAGIELATRALAGAPFREISTEAHERDLILPLMLCLAHSLAGVRRQATEIRGRVLS